ncbi:MAG: site-specific integrase [Thiobacillus sp.]|nr:site-specific integrase [Thiobacillus sp.]
MATIRKRGELQWQAIVKRKGHPLQSKTWNTRKEAEAWARRVESEMDRGVFVSRGETERTTIADLIERYREDELPKKRGKGFGPALKTLESELGAYSLAALSSKIVTDYRKKRLTAGLSGDTVRKEINLLSRIIDLAGKEWGLPLPANPCAMVARPAPGKARERRLEGDELGRLLAAAGEEKHLGALIVVAVETAARLGELLSVTWTDVDLQKRVMVLRGIDGRGTKNADAFRAVPLSTEALRALKEVKNLPASIDGRVFYWWKASDSFNKTWRRARARAGVEGLRFHDLRHEATSRLFEKGVFDSMEVASITGHKTLQMLKRYTHLRAEDLAKRLA